MRSHVVVWLLVLAPLRAGAAPTTQGDKSTSDQSTPAQPTPAQPTPAQPPAVLPPPVLPPPVLPPPVPPPPVLPPPVLPPPVLPAPDKPTSDKPTPDKPTPDKTTPDKSPSTNTTSTKATSDKAAPSTASLDVPMELLASRPLVRAKINGQGPFALLVDPQAVTTLIDPRLAETLNLKPLPGTPGTPHYQVDLGFGESIVAKVPVEIVDLTRFAPELPATARPRGVISLSIWRDQLVTIDFARWRIEIAAGGLPEPNGKDIVALSAAGQLQLQLVIGEYSAPCEIDPVFPGGLLLPSGTATGLSLADKPRTVASVNTRTGPIPAQEARLTTPGIVGGFTFNAPLVQFGGTNDRALLGTAWLSSFALTYDLSHARVRLDRQRLP
jgi:hypothetical protein